MSGEMTRNPTVCLLAHGDHIEGAIIQRRLGRVGMDVEVVGSLEECAKSLQRRQFDVIVTSLKLADAEAWELERLARGEELCSPALQIFVLCETSMYGQYLPIAQQRKCELIPEDDLLLLEQLVEQAVTKRTKPSVLLIEDNRAQAQAAAQALSDHFDTEVQYDGLGALEAWRRKHHQLIVLDLKLPRIEGARLLELIKNDAPSQLVLVVSGVLSRYRREKLLAAGATDVLAKPYLINELPSRCYHILHHGALKRAAEESQAKGTSLEKVSRSVALANETLLSGQSALTRQHLCEALEVCVPVPEATDDELTHRKTRADEWLKSSGPWAREGQG